VTRWLLAASVRRAPRRLLLAALGVAFPVAMLAATLLFVDAAARAMTPVALAPVQVPMRALATSLDVDMDAVGRRLAAVPGVAGVDRFAAADVTVRAPGTAARATARLFAVDPAYLRRYPWVRVAGGTLGGGALLNETLRSRPGFAGARAVSVELPDGARPLATVPVTGTVDLRQATTWFAIPTGEVQGDVAVVPRALVVDYATFERSLLPALRRALGPTTSVLNPGLTDLPPVDLEAHLAVDRRAYPADPGRAAAWSERLREELERQAPGAVVVADEAAEFLALAADDATNAWFLFLLLAVPGVLCAAGLSLAAESALAEAHRREDALLRLRGASEGQLARLAAAHAALAGAAGALAGLAAAVAAVSAVNGRPVWREVPAGRLAASLALALCAAAAIVGVRLWRLRRAGRRGEVAAQRRLLERGWAPTWRRARLDLVAVAAGATVLVAYVVTGGLRRAAVEGLSLSLFFSVLLAPIALWLGVALLAVRGLLAAAARRARPGRAPPRGWRGATLRWVGRRPARTAVALTLGILAVAFGTEVVAFVATYHAARQADAAAAFGADLRLVPATGTPAPLPPLGPAVAATTPVRYVPARAGTDRKTIIAVDPATYPPAVTVAPRMLAGRGVEALAGDPSGVLVAQEIADGFGVGPGDPLPVTVYPDDDERARNLSLRVVGVFRSFPPTDLLPELVVPAAGLAPPLLPPPDFHLARVAPGRSPAAVAAELSNGGRTGGFAVATAAGQVRREHRSLTALNLAGLSRIEAAAAGLAAALGVAVLGGFLVVERRRELAVLRTVGAGTAQALTGPAQEGAIAALGSLAIGVPLGLGLAVLAARVLGLFFFLPPPLLTVPALPLAALGLLVAAASALALGLALAAVNRRGVPAVLREP
jgi:putative ABC transport system permease protein